ncbi:MAG: outer membrane beta-barrel protein [bacterium]|nr:outer membrane beta-barrel protein [bacterium]
MRNKFALRVCVFGLLVACIATPALAVNIEKKFRIGFNIGGLNGQDEVTSDSANVLTLVDDLLTPTKVYIDPRNDSSVFGSLELQPGALATLNASYAVNKIFVIEASVGYQQTDLGDVELQAQFLEIEIPEQEPFNFTTFRVRAGDIERIPIQLSAMARFRPRANFNPYFGGGVGYSFVGFEPSSEFDQLSLNMDAALGDLAAVDEATFGRPTFDNSGVVAGDLQGARVDVDDSFEWHLLGGFDYSFNAKWTMVVDFRYVFSSRDIFVGFNGDRDLGSAVPAQVDFLGSEVDPPNSVYGAVLIRNGGLIDGGALQAPLTDPEADCVASPGSCVFVIGAEDPDGVSRLDPGYYYVQGGQLDLDAFSFQIGMRYTF